MLHLHRLPVMYIELVERVQLTQSTETYLNQVEGQPRIQIMCLSNSTIRLVQAIEVLKPKNSSLATLQEWEMF